MAVLVPVPVQLLVLVVVNAPIMEVITEFVAETKLEPLHTIEGGTYCFISLFYDEPLTGELCIVPNLNRRDAILQSNQIKSSRKMVREFFVYLCLTHMVN